MYVDCHCHLAENYFYRDLVDYIKIWEQNKIRKIGSIATNLKSSRRNLEISKINSDIEIIPSIGRHPWGAHKVTEDEKIQFKELIKNNQNIIIGEIGLDYYFVKDQTKQKKQLPLLKFFLELASKYKKPIMLHTTGAESDILEVLQNVSLKSNICCHWYSGSIKVLKSLIDLGCYFSINQAIMKSKQHRAVAEIVGVEFLLTESDGPINFNNEKASPLLMPLIIEQIAGIKSMKNQEIKTQIMDNYERYLQNVL